MQIERASGGDPSAITALLTTNGFVVEGAAAAFATSVVTRAGVPADPIR
jgi:hypothetical protein